MKDEKIRQLSAIMFTDIVGYTALMQGDEEMAVNVRSRHRQIFQKQHELHQGKILQYYGDGTLSVFKSAILAAKCAIEIQLALQDKDPVPLRIGLHIGDIVFDKTEVYGDGVNYASRIESLSVAGAILLSKPLNDELKNHKSISTTSLGHFELKNITLPVEVFAITNAGIVVPDPAQLEGKQKTSSNILLTKLHISQPGPQTVHRSELFEKLTKGLQVKLMLISAPAGFGKTTLVSDWIIQQKIPSVWYSIDSSDNDVSKFWGYIITAIQGIYPEFGENTMKLLHSSKPGNHESIVRLIINEIISLPRHFLLALDDFHLINNREVLDLFAYFIEHIPINIHVAILTRADPILPLAKLRSRHQLVELRSADLSFSGNEIQFLFNKKLKLNLSPSDVESLVFKTEGWIAGLQLIAISLRDREDAATFIQEFKGDNRYIMDYLIEEVLKIQTPEIREFLIQTSLLEQLSGPLCNAILDRSDSQSVLEMLENNNMFIVSLDSDRKWYRYHHLFSDLLKQRLFLQGKPLIQSIHNKAGEWFEQNKMLPLAIEHVLKTQNFDKAIQLLTEITEQMWENGQHSSIIKYGDLLPEDIVKLYPEFSLFYAWVLVTAGQIQKAGPILACAEKLTRLRIEENKTNPEILHYHKKLLGKIAVAIAYQQSFLGNPEIILEYCRIAMESLSENDPLWFSWGWYVVGKAELANSQLFESTEAFKKALVFGKKSGNIYLMTSIAINLGFNEGRLGHYKISYQRSADLLQFLKDSGYGNLVKTDWTFAVLYANMAAIQYFWADLEGASENIKTAYNLCIKEADITSKVLALVVSSVVLHGQGDIIGAEIKVKELEAIMQKNKVNPFQESMYIGWKAIFLIFRNELDKARAFLEAHGIEPDKVVSYVEEYRYFAFAILLIAEKKIDEAFLLVTQLYEMAIAQNRIERMIEIKILLAVIFQATGEKEKAISSLTESLNFAAPADILMSHLNFLDHINPLLQEVFKNQARGETKISNAFINKLKTAIEKRKTAPSNHFNLTTRDLEALQLMAVNLSNQEIADKLFISLNTVKTRLKNLYVKLEVDSRNKAVDKAKEMRLI
ncbi:LuxR C-terminal-related transcriptional regulator [Dyadobacter sp. 3J3]|uniref:LuxR C-terminal-related transcriptional regulator n=1 Tax=Dyadobacter sp. 3J3 TaxID=2606600 RepID=UPI00135A459F|nr:LuxR C-terminal-related transcriptional regulator [Dyadobacter sp. 3J3]